MNKNELKQKLWAAVDDLEDDDGFVLVACSDKITFTRLQASASYDQEGILELEPLNRPQERAERNQLAQHRDELMRQVKTLDAEITAKQARWDDLDEAIANALGRGE